MHDKIGVLIVGCGYWGVNYVRVFDELPNVSLVAVCDQNRERLQLIHQRYRDLLGTADLDEALHLENIDVAVVCTGASSHYPIVRECLAAGKHVLVEKPMTTKICHAKELVAIAETTNVKLMVGHTFLYNAAIERLKTFVDGWTDGRVHYLYARRTNMGPIRSDVDAIWDLAPHDVSIFNYLLGATPLWVSAVGVDALQEARADAGFISLGYPDGVLGNIHVSWVDPNKVRELVLVGSNHRIVFDDLNALERIKIFEKGIAPVNEPSGFGEHHFTMRDGDIFSPHIPVSEPLKNQCRHFLSCITEDRRPKTDGWAGLDVVRVMAAIEESVQQHGIPVNVS